MMRSATVKQLEIMGHAASKISSKLKKKYPELNWKVISSFKDVLIHEYFGINYELVWTTAKFEVHTLKEQFEKILDEYLEEYGKFFD
jgi:uncharacterized protein with HEPN domain